MQSRRDQLHAYRFQVRRAIAALVAAEPDVQEPPMRRLTVTTLAGLMIAILVAAGFAVVGLVRPGSGDAWRNPGTVIVEKETGARFILVDGVLHPVLNYASAVLALGDQTATVQLVSHSALAGTPRGATIGIDGLPDSLPSAGQLIREPWSVCSTAAIGSDNVTSVSVALHGGDDQGSQPIAADDAVLVSAPDASAYYLIWHGERLAVANDHVLQALGAAAPDALPVGQPFLNALPVGPDLVAPEVPNLGAPGPAVGAAATVVGQVLNTGNGSQNYLVLSDGLIPVNQLDAKLLQTAALPAPPAVDQAAVQQAHPSTAWQPPQGLPTDVPAMSTAPADASAICAVYAGTSGQPAIGSPRRSGTIPAARVRAPVQQFSTAQYADQVVIAPGRAALVTSDSGSPTLFLVAAPGEEFPMTADVLKSFGYAASNAVMLPARLLLLMPPGPALDPTAARTEQVAGGGTPSTLPAPSPGAS